MLRSDTLFGKRESNTPNPPLSTANSSSLSNSSTSGSAFNKSSAGGFNTSSQAQAPAPSVNEVGSKLIVGPNIKLKGVEITDCDTLVVEGFVEATMDSRVIQIAKDGSFKGCLLYTSDAADE